MVYQYIDDILIGEEKAKDVKQAMENIQEKLRAKGQHKKLSFWGAAGLKMLFLIPQVPWKR